MTKPEGWIEATAVIISCRFQFARLNTLTFGIQTGQKFRIAFEYYAQGRLYTAEFQSPTAIPQSERIELAYNPADPKQNTRSTSSTNPTRSPLLAVGIAGSIILSLLWFAILRGCGQP